MSANEIHRLERQVLKACKRWREDWLMNSHQLRDAIDAWIRAEQKRKKPQQRKVRSL